MPDERLKQTIKNQKMKQAHRSFNQYTELSIELKNKGQSLQEFIADIHINGLTSGFLGIEELNRVLNDLKDAQEAVVCRFDLIDFG